jgi:uncharacterized protein (DUF934 family)
MALLEKRGVEAAILDDHFARVEEDATIPASGDVLVSLDRFQSERDALVARSGAVGVWLRSDQTPDALAEDLDRIALVALDFPTFADGRGYSSARLLRERYGYKGELRAIGDVLCEQLTFMLRSGFDTFEMASPNALAEFRAIVGEVRIVYQPTGDGEATATDLRLGRAERLRRSDGSEK